jgi:Inner membrane protein YqiJ, OB-fold/Inner membrane protein YqiJ, N-terminal
VSAFFAPELWPYALATGLLVAVAATEALALLIGMSTSLWHDGAVFDHPDGFAGELLGWLHIGKVPILVILVIFLTTFAVAGFAAQLVAKFIFGYFMPLPAGVGVALVAGVCGVRVFGVMLGKIIPKDETTAVADASLVGRVGVIVIGTAHAGRPAQARLRDEHGTTHYVMVEPEEPDQSFMSGQSVLLVRHLSGRRFHAIHNPKPELL